MTSVHSDLRFAADPRVLILEAEPGQCRRSLLERWVQEARQAERQSWLLPCDHESNGPWSGLLEFFSDVVAGPGARNPDLLVKHDYELVSILPRLQRTLRVRNPSLTDVSPDTERTRNYPADRAYRIVHGLIDLLLEARARGELSSLALACDDLDRSGALVQFFFRELLRRGRQLDPVMLLVVAPGRGDLLAQQFTSAGPSRLRLELPPDAPVDIPSPGDMTAEALALEERARVDAYERQMLLPQLVRCWQMSDQPERALTYRLEAATLYNTRGFYKEVLPYAEPAFAQLEHRCRSNNWEPEVLGEYANFGLKLISTYLALGRPTDAFHVTEAILSRTNDPRFMGPLRYMRAMLYARFFPKRNLLKAEAELEQGLVELERANISPAKKAFSIAFNRNGLALVRHQQGRPDDAIALCRWAHAHLESHLDEGVHLLHRSVLSYNIAQVCNAMGRHEDALRSLGEAMAMDPNYSEYYNERGTIYLKLERFDLALSDFLKAIELSPPYMEVWTNLAQCYLLMGRAADAVRAYSRALDLEPKCNLALVGRAQAYDELGQVDAALADYDTSLALEPDQPMVLMNRAVLRFNAGLIEQAVDDLSHGIELAPDMAILYENRAVAFDALGKRSLAAHDRRINAELSQSS